MAMVPGPWNDGPLTTEVHDIGAGVITRTADTLVESPVASGWSVAGWRSWQASASAGESISGGMSEEPPVGPEISQGAWDAAINDMPVSDGVGGDPAVNVSHPSMQMSNNGLGMWFHSERWSLEGGYWKFRYRKPNNNWTQGVTPPWADWPEGANYIEFDYPDPAHSQYWIDLLSVTVIGTGNAGYVLDIKKPNEVGPWFGDGGDPESTGDNASVGGSIRTLVTDSLVLPVEPFDAFVQENVEGGEVSQYDLRWLSGSVITTSWPGAYGRTVYSGAYGPPEGCGQIVLTYRPPRWRYWFVEPETVPYRRTYPRDDALGGGAARTWPPSKAVQSSNRTFGGYL